MQEPHLTTPLAICNWASLTLKVVWQKGHWVSSCDMDNQDSGLRFILP